MTIWPSWWHWELELTPHVEKRMEDGDFIEVDLRAMLERAHRLRQDLDGYRYVVETTHRGNAWEVIVQPDFEDAVVVVITAYRVSQP